MIMVISKKEYKLTMTLEVIQSAYNCFTRSNLILEDTYKLNL